ncbi:MAG: 30S ribosomal protein S6 [candidate division Zixibacteria bacterium]|nr:30S ribosomal protein S6 [candidate division Zixibacteria bacterium]
MRLYETTFVLSPQADDAAFDRQIKAVTDLINRYEGKVVRESRWGIRRLAYPIKRFTQGFYTRTIFEGNQTVLTELERFYKIEEPYIRYLTVLFEGNLEEELSQAAEESYGATISKPAFEPVVEVRQDKVEVTEKKPIAIDKAEKPDIKKGVEDDEI